MDKLPLDILKIIFEFLDFKSKIKLISTCTYMRQNLHIIDLYDIEIEYSEKLITKIFKYNIFKNVLYIVGKYGIGQNFIKTLNLYELDVNDNKKIRDISFMKNLKKLNASDNCGIDQNGIIGLDLIELHVSGNNKIKNISFMKNLKKLNAYGKCGIDQNSIKGLKLIEFNFN